MPRSNKKRGRRISKRKLEDVDEDSDLPENTKRRKSTDMAVDGEDGFLDGAYPPVEPQVEKPFFGMLDDDEQEYFRRADDMLEANAFGDQEERDLFLMNVFREADGKEIKLAQSQSCSRLMERLIQLSTPAQLKVLFNKFGGNLIHLVTHRFSSHCCEALLTRAAPIVTDELLYPAPKDQQNGVAMIDGSDADASMESLFLSTLDELEGNLGYLLTDRYASHVVRILLLVLSGEPVDTASTKNLRGKRKETNTIQGEELMTKELLSKKRTVPESFSHALDKIVSESIAGLNTEKLRVLATHPDASPTLQLMLRLEMTHFGKQRAKDEASVIRTLLPDDPITKDSNSAIFINGLIYDTIGSHLVETIVQYAPGKMFKSLYSEFFKERLASHSRNETAGYVVCRILERLGHDDLLDAHELLIPSISPLLQRNRTIVIRTLIERCTIRDIDTKAIAAQIHSTWPLPEGFEVKKLVKFEQGIADDVKTPQDSIQSSASPTATLAFTRDGEPTKVHFNILAQAMLIVPGALSSLVLDSFMNLDPDTLLKMARDPIVSRTLQAAVTSRNASMIVTRKLIQHFYGHIGEMATDTAASHVVDCMWEGTHGLAFIRERIAEELAENEAQLRESPCGRMVWKNWKMDLYKRRRGDWIRQSKIKASNDGFQSFSELEINKDKDITAKTPLQLARERHAQGNKKKKGKDKDKPRGRRMSSGGPTTSSMPAAATAST